MKGIVLVFAVGSSIFGNVSASHDTDVLIATPIVRFDQTLTASDELNEFAGSLSEGPITSESFRDALDFARLGRTLPAAVILGRLTRMGGKENYEAAKLLLEAMIDGGSSFAIVVKGQLVRMGVYPQEDKCDAVAYFTKASNRGMPLAAEKLGREYLAGECVEEDKFKGLQLITEAAEAGIPSALSFLASTQHENAKTETEKAVALEMMKKAIAAGSNEARVNMAKIQISRGAPIDEVVPVLQEAVDNDYFDAVSWLVRYLYRQDELLEDYKREAAKSMENFERVPVADIQYALGIVAEHGWDGTEKSEKAVTHFKFAHELGSALGSLRYARALYVGNGVEQNKCKAFEVLSSLSAEGNSDARARLEQLTFPPECRK